MANNTTTSPQTLKLEGKLRGIPIQVLVDSSTSHNFIFHKLVSMMGLPTRSFFGLYIRLGNGHQVRVQ